MPQSAEQLTYSVPVMSCGIADRAGHDRRSYRQFQTCPLTEVSGR